MVINHKSVLKALGVAGVIVVARPSYAADSSMNAPTAATPTRIAAPATSDAAASPVLAPARPNA
ncbi:MAG: hypothetical protein ACKVU4_08340 [Phycisphaerales bacterium]